MLVGIAGQESNYGVTSNPDEGRNIMKYGLKSKLRTDYESIKDIAASLFKKEGASRGVLQVKDKNIFKNAQTRSVAESLGVTKENYNPDDIKQNTILALTLLDNIDLQQLPSFNNQKISKERKFIGTKDN